MTPDELKAALRRLSGLMDTPRRELRVTAVVACLAELSAAVDDDATEVPTEAFAELSPELRKLALAGLTLLAIRTLDP